MVARWCWWLAVTVPATSGWPFAKKRRASSETAATPSGEAVTLSYRAASSAASSASWSKAGYIEAGAPVRLVERRGGFAAPAPERRAYEWLRPGAWEAYVARLYGPAVGGGAYPAVGDVDTIYDAEGLLGGRDFEAKCPARDDVPFKRFNWHAPFKPRVYYFRRRAWPDGPAPAHANHSWVEVSHCGGSKFERVGAFFYAFRGTGLFANVGRTVAFETHQDAAIHFLGRPCDRGKPNDEQLGIFQCDRELPLFVAAARDRGWDSLQFTHHCDAFCDQGRMGDALSGAAPRSQVCGFEVVFARTSGTTACPPGVEFRQGLNASLPCRCTPASALHSQRGSCAACDDAPFLGHRGGPRHP